MSAVSVEAKVGVFVVIGIVILGYMSMKVGKLTFSREKGYDVEVLFDSASGLAQDVTVEIAGVEIGRVQTISLENGRALVVLHIKPGIVLSRDVKALIRTKGILGDKYVEIIPGSSSAPAIEPGGRIVTSVAATDMDTLMNTLGDVARDVKKLTAALSNVIGSERGEASLQAIVDNVREMVTTLNQTVQNNNADVNRIVANLSDFAETLKRIGDTNAGDIDAIVHNVRRASENIEDLLAGLKQVADKLNTGDGSIAQLINDKSTVENLNSALLSMKTVADKISSGEGTVSRLINEDETVENLNATLSGINDFLGKQDTFRTFLDYRGEYLFDSEAVKGYFSLKIQPRDDKYYLFQIVSDPDGRKTVTDTTTTVNGVTTEEHKVEIERDELSFSAQIAKRYYDFGVRGGFMESTGGIGLDYYLLDDKLTFSFDAFDFDPDRNPHLKFRADYTPIRHLYLSSGFDDFISDEGQASFFIGAGISFADEDIKTLMSSIPIPKN